MFHLQCLATRKQEEDALKTSIENINPALPEFDIEGLDENGLGI
jgi:hypothetical protein